MMSLIWVGLALADRPRDVFDDASHPLHVACKAAFDNQGLFEDCVKRTARRADAVAEVEACAMLDVRARRSCVDTMPQRAYPAGSTVKACVMAFGAEADVCVQHTLLDPGDASGEVAACRTVYARAKDALGCVARFSRTPAPQREAILACKDTFPEEFERCISALEPATVAKADVVEACAADHTDARDAIKCVARYATVPAPVGAAIATCSEVYPERTDQCLGLLERAQSPLDGVLKVCKGAGADEKTQLKCVERALLAERDVADGLAACIAVTDGYRPECFDRVVAAPFPLARIVKACGDGLPEKASMHCVKGLAEYPSANADSVAGCMTLFDDEGDKLACVEVAGTRDASVLDACREGSAKDRLRCLGR